MNLKYLNLAFEYAEKAFVHGEVPIGAVIIKNNEIIGVGYNVKEEKQSVLAHAELIAINQASKKLNNWRLDNCDIYVTLDPCPMCASAIKQARIKNVYSAISNKDENNNFLIKKIFETDKVNIQDGYKIAHVSDYHNTDNGFLNDAVLSSLRAEKPDAIVLTGDLINDSILTTIIETCGRDVPAEYMPQFEIVDNFDEYYYEGKRSNKQ